LRVKGWGVKASALSLCPHPPEFPRMGISGSSRFPGTSLPGSSVNTDYLPSATPSILFLTIDLASS